MSKKKKVVLIILTAAATLALAAYFYVNGMLDKINYSDGTAVQSAEPSVATEEVSAGPESAAAGPETAEEINEAERNITEQLEEKSEEPVYDEDVLNILLIGCDSRSGEITGRSDSMILLSVNHKTDKIIITSIMRDIYTYIPGYGYNRINAAFAYGGASLLIDTVEDSFQIRITKFVSVDFFAFIDIVDELGGVTISVSEEELPVLNDYVRGINKLKGLSSDDGLLPSGGADLLLTGKQALGYCRIRYVGNADYERTERQRRVLMQLRDKIKDLGIVELNDLLTVLLPEISTNLDKGEICSLLLSAPELLQYKLEQDRIPIDGSYQGMTIRKMSVLNIDFQKNSEEMKERIYGQ